MAGKSERSVGTCSPSLLANLNYYLLNRKFKSTMATTTNTPINSTQSTTENNGSALDALMDDFQGIYARIVLIVGGCIGATLCATIILLFAQLTRAKRRKISNIILLHQIFVDIVSCIGFGIIYNSWLLYQTTNEGGSQPPVLHNSNNYYVFTQGVSHSSSLFNFAITSAERWLSIARPLYHRSRVTIKRMLAIFIAVWIIALCGGIVSCMLLVTVTEPSYIEFCVMVGASHILVCTITIRLTISAYQKAKYSIRGQQASSSVVTTQQKELGLLKLFIRMFLCFSIYEVLTIGVLVASVVLVSTSGNNGGENTYILKVCDLLCDVLLIMASIANCFITVCCKEDFRSVIRQIGASTGNRSRDAKNAGQLRYI